MNYKTKKWTRIVKILMLLLSLASCNNKISCHQLKGKYFQQEDKNYQITFEDNLFSVSRPNFHHPPYVCCDTITKGTWSLTNDKLITLDNQAILSNHVKSKVHENIREMKDSFYVYIMNSMETAAKKEKRRMREICYRVYIIMGDDEMILDTLVNSDSIRLFCTNVVKSITLFIYTTPYFLGRDRAEGVFMTTEYELKFRQTNILNIDMPELTYPYLTYTRLRQDFVKIVNKNCLEWHGNKYFKK